MCCDALHTANDKLSSISEASLFERVVKWGKAQLSPPPTDTKDGKPDSRLRQLLTPLLKHIRSVIDWRCVALRCACFALVLALLFVCFALRLLCFAFALLCVCFALLCFALLTFAYLCLGNAANVMQMCCVMLCCGV